MRLHLKNTISSFTLRKAGGSHRSGVSLRGEDDIIIFEISYKYTEALLGRSVLFCHIINFQYASLCREPR